jgi:hypothetical protein
MSTTRKYRKTEQRVIRTLYRLQSQGSMESVTLGIYERLLHDTLASRSSLLGSCQRLVKEGTLVRHKVNAADRKRWGRRWPAGSAKRQAYFSLSPATMAAMEARDYREKSLDDDRPMRGSIGSTGDYFQLELADG